MSRPIWINIGLLALIILLSAYLFSASRQTDMGTPVMSVIDSETINRIEIFRKNLDDLIFKKSNGHWYMDSPFRFKANAARMDTMLRLLKTTSHAQLDATERPLHHFALDTPEIIVKLNEHIFKFGNTDAIDQYRYVLFGSTIHLTDDFLYQRLKAGAGFFADTKLLPEETKISRIKFLQNELNRVNGKWQLADATNIGADRLQNLVASWEEATAIFTNAYQKQREEASIIVFDENAQAIEFVIVTAEPHLILAREDIGVQYHIGGDVAETLLLQDNPAVRAE